MYQELELRQGMKRYKRIQTHHPVFTCHAILEQITLIHRGIQGHIWNKYSKKCQLLAGEGLRRPHQGRDLNWSLSENSQEDQGMQPGERSGGERSRGFPGRGETHVQRSRYVAELEHSVWPWGISRGRLLPTYPLSTRVTSYNSCIYSTRPVLVCGLADLEPKAQKS